MNRLQNSAFGIIVIDKFRLSRDFISFSLYECKALLIGTIQTCLILCLHAKAFFSVMLSQDCIDITSCRNLFNKVIRNVK